MKLKMYNFRETVHTTGVVCVSWINTEELFSCGDDHKLVKWNLVENSAMVITTFEEELHPLEIHLFPKSNLNVNKNQHDVILIACADGKFHIVNHNGRIEKTVNAHQGACLQAQWSPDGAGLLTAGEDGFVKVWSRNGLLRSTIAQSDKPCFSAVWSADSSAILHLSGLFIIIKQLNSSNKVTKWKAHEDLILCVAWNTNNNLIISGSEDGSCKVWDTFGQLISVSVKHDRPITSVSWSPAGDMFAIGCFNLIRLCNANGWSQCMDRPASGSIHNISWSSDGTQLAVGCTDNNILFAHIIEREHRWKDYVCIQTGRTVLSIKDMSRDQHQILEYPDRVIQIAIGFSYLVVATVKQCFIHKLSTSQVANTPVTFDLKEGTLSMILISERCICVVERAGLSIYSFMGRLLASPNWGGRSENLGRASISLGPDVLAVIDQNDRNVIQVFDLPTNIIVRSSPNSNVTKLRHKMNVSTVALSQTGPVEERQLAMLDYNRDLYLLAIKDTNHFVKLGSQILSILWSDEAELLIGLQANAVVAWCCPKAALLPEWLQATTITREIFDLGRNPSILSMTEGVVSIYRGDGSLVHVALAGFAGKLLKNIASNSWQDALQLCRNVGDDKLWGCLAILSWKNYQCEIAEEAYARINLFHQAFFIRSLSDLIPQKLSALSTK